MYNELKITVVNEITNKPRVRDIEFTKDTTLVQLTILSMMEEDVFDKHQITLKNKSKSRFVNGTHQNITSFLDDDQADSKLFYSAVWLPEHSDEPFSVELKKVK